MITLKDNPPGLVRVMATICTGLGCTQSIANILLNGEETVAHHFVANWPSITFFEWILSGFGAQLTIEAADPPTEFERLSFYDPGRYQALIETLPLAIPLSPIQPDMVRVRFSALAQNRQHNYVNASTLSLQGVSDRIANSFMQDPAQMPSSPVRSLGEIIPRLLTSRPPLAVYHLPLISGCPLSFARAITMNKEIEGLDRFQRLASSLGLRYRLTAPGGCFTVTSVPVSVRKILAAETKTHAIFEARRESLVQKVTKTPSKEFHRDPSHRGKMDRDAIVALLKQGVKPLEIAKKANVSHQRVYAIAREEGLGRRESTASMAMSVLKEQMRKNSPA